MFWFGVIVVVLVLSLVARRVFRGRRAPSYDQKSLENANYARINQEVHNFDQRFHQGG
jgi:hypothetical protein